MSLISRCPRTLQYLARSAPLSIPRVAQPHIYLRNNLQLRAQCISQPRPFSTTSPNLATLNQVKRGCRQPQRARHSVSPQLRNRPQMKGVCLKVGITKPKKPNSGARKTAKVRLSNGKSVTCYIPGEGHNAQQHSVVLVRGGRAKDCPGVRYPLVRGALDLGGVANRIRGRSKYGTKKPKAAAT